VQREEVEGPRLRGAKRLVGLVEERGALERQSPLARVVLPGAVGVEAQRALAVAPLELRLVNIHPARQSQHVEEGGARSDRLHLSAARADVRPANFRLAVPATHDADSPSASTGAC